MLSIILLASCTGRSAYLVALHFCGSLILRMGKTGFLGMFRRFLC